MYQIFLHLSNLILFRQKCDYHTEYVEKCYDQKQKVCEKYWKQDGYGGKVWTEDPSRCHWLQESECVKEPHPKKVCNDYVEPVCHQYSKNKPQQHECEVCGGVEKSCRKIAEQRYHGQTVY